MKIKLPKLGCVVAATVALLSASPTAVQAQSDFWTQPDIPYIENRGFGIGATFGMTDLWADVGTKSPLYHYYNDKYWNNTHQMGSLFLRYTHYPGLSFRLGLGFGQLYATDEWNKDISKEADRVTDDPYQRYLRNLNVKTNVWETSLLAEIAPLRLFGNWEFSTAANSRFQPYLLLGASAVRFNPKGLFKDLPSGYEKWVDLRPLRTEGQGYNLEGMPDTYSNYTWAIVSGLGVKWDVARAFGVGLEWKMRTTFTDYLDDVSGKYIDPLYHEIAHVKDPAKAKLVNSMMDKSYQVMPGAKHAAGEWRGDPNNNDMFSTINIQFYWKINRNQFKWWDRYR